MKDYTLPKSHSNRKPTRQCDILKTISENKRECLLNMQMITREERNGTPFFNLVRDRAALIVSAQRLTFYPNAVELVMTSFESVDSR